MGYNSNCGGCYRNSSFRPSFYSNQRANILPDISYSISRMSKPEPVYSISNNSPGFGSIDYLVEKSPITIISSQKSNYFNNSNNSNSVHGVYSQSSTGSDYTPQISSKYSMIGVIDPFLNPIRPVTQFIDDASLVEDYIKETFTCMMNRAFPDDIIVKVCDKATMKQIHEQMGATWQDGIMGFAINKKPQAVSQIFVMQNDLDKLMLVIGHELGHVLSQRLDNSHDEEAKAFAFELAWANVLRDHNVANLGDCLCTDLKPANNGLHNVAFDFVRKMIQTGLDAFEVYVKLIKRSISLMDDFDAI